MNSDSPTNALKILIVEDESIMAMQLREAVSKLGHEVVGVAKKGETAIELARIEKPDLIFMDIDLGGGMNGIETAGRILEDHSVYTVFITAFSDAPTLKAALSLPQSDYLVKPVHDRQINVAIEKVKKAKERNTKNENALVSLAHDCTYEPDTGKLSQNGIPVPLTKKERVLFIVLVEKKGKLVSYEEIEHAVWQAEAVSDNTRKNLIHRLNKKLSPSPIEVIFGHGLILFT